MKFLEDLLSGYSQFLQTYSPRVRDYKQNAEGGDQGTVKRTLYMGFLGK